MHILEQINRHLENVVINVNENGNEQKYKMSEGIPQGSILSSVLCDIYYGSMEMLFMDPSLQGNGD